MNNAVFAIERLESRLFLSAGQLDPTFGHGGELVLSPPLEFYDGAGSPVMLPDGKTLVLVQHFRFWYEIRRYGTNYRLDKSFGRQGHTAGIFYDDGFYAGNSADFAVQADGKILYLYHQFSIRGDQQATRIKRYLSNGHSDRTFGDQGTVTLWQSEQKTPDGAACVLPLPDGGILVGGPPDHSVVPRIMLERLRPNGKIDRTFAKGGTASFQLPKGVHIALSSLLRQPDGKILCVGTDNPTSRNAGSKHVFIARFNPDGSVDRTFGQRGLATAFIRPDANSDAIIGNVVLQSDGGILVSAVAFGADAFLMRFNANGSLDTRYGLGGRAVYWRTKNLGIPAQVELQADNSAIFALPTPNSILVGRLNTNGQIDPTFAVTQTRFGGEDVAWPFTQPDGDILLVGQRGIYSAQSAIIVARYQGGHVNVIRPY